MIAANGAYEGAGIVSANEEAVERGITPENTELRFHLGRVKTSLLPFYYGIVTFYDQGKVWYKGSDDGGWHRGYGAGFYFAPLEQRYALNVLFGHSAEETLLLQFSLGLVLDR